MTPTDPTAVYDPSLALARACGRTEVRDRMLIGLLDLLDDPDTVHRLLDVQAYGREPAICREIAHRLSGLARQLAMPELAALCQALTDALDAGDQSDAERLGQRLPGAIAALQAALSAPEPAGPPAG